jgi:hypothetical protein
MWNDTAHLSAAMFGCVEKTLAAEDGAPADITHVLWDYTPLKPRTAARVRDMRAKGLDVWIAPGRRPEDVEDWKRLALHAGCSGMVMTAWAPVAESNRMRFLDLVRTVGQIYARGEEAGPASPAGAALPTVEHVTNIDMEPAVSMDDPILAPNRLGEPLAGIPYLLPPDVYVRNWMVLGPFPFVPGDYAGPEPRAVIDDGRFVGDDEAALAAGEPGAEAFGVTWRRYAPAAGSRFPQVIDLRRTYEGSDYTLAYAVAHVHSEEEMDGCSICLGADDYVKVWLNGRPAHTWAEGSRAIMQDDDRILGVALRKGWNKLLVKCANLKATWGFLLRFTDSAGRPLTTE